MADDERFQKTWTVEGVPYTFRVLSNKAMRAVQAETTRLSDGTGDMFVRGYTERIALLQAACVTPTDVDWDSWPDPQLDTLVREVQQWWNSFRRLDAEPGGSMGGGGRDSMAVPVSPDLPAASA